MSEELAKKVESNTKKLFIGLWDKAFQKIDEMAQTCIEVEKKSSMPIVFPFPSPMSPGKTVHCDIKDDDITSLVTLLDLIESVGSLFVKEEEVDTSAGMIS
jgi:hypothetical protein